MIKLGILGYGNLGRGVEIAARNSPDIEVKSVFTRRNPADVDIITKGAAVYNIEKIYDMKNEIDALIICGGSATDLPVQTPEMAKHFNVVDSFDTHAKIPEHFENVNKAAFETGHTAIISAGWDPGMFSLARLYSNAILPDGKDYTFWGKGISQGHSDAIRRIEGVLDARQYTIPVPEAMEKVRSGSMPELTTREKHIRECYVVAKEDADKARIESEIKNMPNYFADYDTTVHFVTKEVLEKEHSGMPHGGRVIRSGRTGLEKECSHTIEYSLKLDSNPQFTSSVLVACARAVVRMNKEGQTGCKTMFDIPPAYLSYESPEELRKRLL